MIKKISALQKRDIFCTFLNYGLYKLARIALPPLADVAKPPWPFSTAVLSFEYYWVHNFSTVAVSSIPWMNTISSSFWSPIATWSSIISLLFPLPCDAAQKKGTKERGKNSQPNHKCQLQTSYKRNPGMNKWQPYNYLNRRKIHYYLSQWLNAFIYMHCCTIHVLDVKCLIT